MQTSVFTCSKCDDDRNGVAYCGTCKVYLCDPCVDNHARRSKTMGHIVLDSEALLPFYPQELTKSKEKNHQMQTSIKHLAEECRGHTDGECQAGDFDFEHDVGVITAATQDRQRLRQDLTQSEEEIRQMQMSINHLVDECREQTDDQEADDSDFKHDVEMITSAIEKGKRLNKELTKTKEENLHMKMTVNAVANESREHPYIQGASTIDCKGRVTVIFQNLPDWKRMFYLFFPFLLKFCVFLYIFLLII